MAATVQNDSPPRPLVSSENFEATIRDAMRHLDAAEQLMIAAMPALSTADAAKMAKLFLDVRDAFGRCGEFG